MDESIMTERALWHVAQTKLAPYGRLVRVENRCDKGTQDLAYCLQGHSGWLELKHRATWPARCDTPLLVASLKKEQVLWMEAWVNAGGAAAILLQIARSYFLLTPAGGRMLFERKLTRESIYRAPWCQVSAENNFPTREIVLALCRAQDYKGLAIRRA